MRAVIQRVSRASVAVKGETVGAIGRGLLVLLGIRKGDAAGDAEYLVEKTLGLRIFPDENGKMNRNVREVDGALLVISQFTLYGDCRRGRRPSFDLAAAPEDARALYEYFVIPRSFSSSAPAVPPTPPSRARGRSRPLSLPRQSCRFQKRRPGWRARGRTRHRA